MGHQRLPTHHPLGGTRARPAPLSPLSPRETSSGGKSGQCGCLPSPGRGSASWGHGAGGPPLEHPHGRSPWPESPEPQPHRAGVLPTLRPDTRQLSPEESWIMTNPERIRGKPSAEGIIRLVGYTDFSWPSAQGYTLQDSETQPVGLQRSPPCTRCTRVSPLPDSSCPRGPQAACAGRGHWGTPRKHQS